MRAANSFGEIQRLLMKSGALLEWRFVGFRVFCVINACVFLITRATDTHPRPILTLF